MANNDLIILDQIISQRKAATAADMQEGDFFELFVADQLLKDHQLSWDEIQQGQTGGPNDGGIDAIYLFVDGQYFTESSVEDFEFSTFKKDDRVDLVMLQTKWTPGFTEAAVDRFMAVSGDILDLSKDLVSLAGAYNSKVLAAAERFRSTINKVAGRFPTYSFRYFYASRGEGPAKNTLRKGELLRKQVEHLFSPSKVEITFLGARQLLELARRTPSRSQSLVLADLPLASPTGDAYICLIKLPEFSKFLTDQEGHLGSTLFEFNVRDYLGPNEVNEAIQRTLKEGKHEFWWLNNGITIVADKASLNGKTLVIQDPLIVNGLQTSNEIDHYFRDAGNPTDPRSVMVKVIVPPKPEIRDLVINATNNQTKIAQSSLRATELIHRNIEDYLKNSAGLFYDRRKNFYKNQGRSLDRIVSITQLAQAVAAVLLQEPETARARPGRLFKDDKRYRSIFDSQHPLGMYLGSVRIMRLVDEFLKKKVPDLSEKDRTNCRHYVATWVSASHCKKHPPSAADIAGAASTPPSDEELRAAYTKVREIYDALGASDQAAKGADFASTLKQKLSEAVSSP